MIVYSNRTDYVDGLAHTNSGRLIGWKVLPVPLFLKLRAEKRIRPQKVSTPHGVSTRWWFSRWGVYKNVRG